MAYEDTVVPVNRSQEKIRALILANKGTGIAFISESDPPTEGFQAKVSIDGVGYTIRIQAKLKKARDAEQERRRVWRVLFHHLKDIFEAANSGVMDFRELMMPYIVTNDGRTVAECILPKLEAAISGNPARLLPAPNDRKEHL